MKAKVLIIAFILVGITACTKDQFTTAPKLTFKQVNTQELSPGQLIEFQLEYTDKEGDIQDSIYIQKLTKNCVASNFEGLYAMPSDVPVQSNTKAEIDIRFAYGTNLGYPAIKEPACLGQNDTCVFRFVLSDKEKHSSDTILSPEIILIKR
jgi:hypothetical protein